MGNASKERRLASCYSASLSSQVFTQTFNQTPDRYIHRMKEIQLNLPLVAATEQVPAGKGFFCQRSRLVSMKSQLLIEIAVD